MGWLKIVIAFVLIAMMESWMEDRPNWTEFKGCCFEIAMSILFAGWIANSGW